MKIIEFIENSNRASNTQELLNLFQGVLKEFGYDKFVYSLITDNVVLGTAAKHGVAVSYPEDWMKYFSEKNYINYDPTFRQVVSKRGFFTWDDLQKNLPMTKKEKNVLDEAKDAGLKSGLSMSVQGMYGEVVGFGLANNSQNEPLTQDKLCELYAIANQFNLVYNQLEIGDQDLNNLGEIKLSDREREVLLWAARGKSKGDTGDIMGISESTVDYFLRSIYQKLKINSKTQAVLRAFQLGLVYF